MDHLLSSSSFTFSIIGAIDVIALSSCSASYVLAIVPGCREWFCGRLSLGTFLRFLCFDQTLLQITTECKAYHGRFLHKYVLYGSSKDPSTEQFLCDAVRCLISLLALKPFFVKYIHSFPNLTFFHHFTHYGSTTTDH